MFLDFPGSVDDMDKRCAYWFGSAIVTQNYPGQSWMSNDTERGEDTGAQLAHGAVCMGDPHRLTCLNIWFSVVEQFGEV